MLSSALNKALHVADSHINHKPVVPLSQQDGLKNYSRLCCLQSELSWEICGYLPASDVAALRLTCRTLERNSYNSFTNLFRYRTILLTPESLNNFVAMTQRDELGCLLRSCTIQGVAQDELAQQNDDVDGGDKRDAELQRLLTQGFTNLATHGQSRSLTSLTLGIAARVKLRSGSLLRPPHFRSARAIWKRARETFDIVMAALHESQLVVEDELNVFTDTVGCSLEVNHFTAIHRRFLSFNPLQTITTLRLSISLEYTSDSDTYYIFNNDEDLLHSDFRSDFQIVQSDGVLQIVRQVLARCMPDVERLEVHWYTVGIDLLTEAPLFTETLFDKQIELPRLSLKECRLYGVGASPQQLFEFIDGVRPKALTLTDLCMINGSWDSVISHLTDPATAIESFHLDDLAVRGDGQQRLVHFAAPGGPKFRYGDNAGWPSTITRPPGTAKEHLRYREIARDLDTDTQSNAFTYWRQLRAARNGPPNSCRWFDFIKLNDGPLPTLAFGVKDDDL